MAVGEAGVCQQGKLFAIASEARKRTRDNADAVLSYGSAAQAILRLLPAGGRASKARIEGLCPELLRLELRCLDSNEWVGGAFAW